MRGSNLASSCEDERTDSRSSHGMLDEQFLRLIKLSNEIPEEFLKDVFEDA